MDTHLANPVLWPTKVYMSQSHPVTFLRGVQYKLYGESASLRRTYIYQYTCSQFFLGQAVKVKTNSRTQLYWCYMYFKSLIITSSQDYQFTDIWFSFISITMWYVMSQDYHCTNICFSEKKQWTNTFKVHYAYNLRYSRHS